MKKIIKSCTLWFLVSGIIIVILNLANLDDLNLLMIFLNPILNILSSSSLCAAIADVPYLWHILSILTMIMYGLLFDLIRHLRKDNENN